MSLATRNIPSADNRPAEEAWTQEEQERHAAGRAITVALAQKRAKSIYLANEHETVRFEVDGDNITITHRTRMQAFIVTMSRDQARGEYSRLLAAGYWKW